MIIGPLQLAHAATITGNGGVQTYMEDMDRINTVLSSAPQSFSWWTAVLLVLILLAWCAALTVAWIYLIRRVGKPPDAEVESISAPFDRPILDGGYYLDFNEADTAEGPLWAAQGRSAGTP